MTDRKIVSIETDTWPLVPARWFTKHVGQGRRVVKWVVIHDMEYPETITAAEQVAKYFSNPTRKVGTKVVPVKASAHICVDSDSIVQCVKDNDIAYAAPGANANGIQIECAGYARQSREQWLDPYGVLMLNLAANAVGQYCLKYNLPVVKLTDAQLRAGKPGIIGHDQASRVFKLSDHTDPGVNFPWDWFIARVAHHHALRYTRFFPPVVR